MIAIKTNLAVEGMSEQPLTRSDDGTLIAPVGEMPIILAALGPKMTALSGQLAQGSIFYTARNRLGRRCI